jgi:hypothetical protein
VQRSLLALARQIAKRIESKRQYRSSPASSDVRPSTFDLRP